VSVTPGAAGGALSPVGPGVVGAEPPGAGPGAGGAVRVCLTVPDAVFTVIRTLVA
jgi:hypothetical protein